jgi:hypothetical protein
VILGNWAGLVTLVSLLLAFVGMATGIIALQLFFVPFGVAYIICMRMDHRQDRLRIAANGDLFLNGRPMTVDRVLDELPLDDPYLVIEPIESKIAKKQFFREGPAAFRPRINWFLWVDREYDPEQVPEQALKLITALQKRDVPFACTWVSPLPARSRE